MVEGPSSELLFIRDSIYDLYMNDGTMKGNWIQSLAWCFIVSVSCPAEKPCLASETSSISTYDYVHSYSDLESLRPYSAIKPAAIAHPIVDDATLNHHQQ